MKNDKKVRVAIIGAGNCASSLVQGVQFYKDAKDDDRVPGLMHVNVGITSEILNSLPPSTLSIPRLVKTSPKPFLPTPITLLNSVMFPIWASK